MGRGEIQPVVGPPGSGKTTGYIAQQVERAVNVFGTAKVAVLSMTRAAAARAAGTVKLPEDAVLTLHAKCYRGLGCPLLVDDRDTQPLVDWNRAYPTMALSLPESGLEAFDPVSASRRAPGDHLRAQYDLLRNRLEPSEAWAAAVRFFAARFEEWKRSGGLYDFTNLIERAFVELPICPSEPAAIFVDEAQDHSALEIALIKRWAEQAHKTALVGDPFQSIYQWRGAKPRLFLEGTAAPITLSRSYRLPRAVHAEAERLGRPILPELSRCYSPRGEDGVVRRFPAPFGDPEKVAATIESALADSAGGNGTGHGSVMFVATCGYMVAPVLDVLRDRTIPYSNPYVADDPRWNPLSRWRSAVQALFAPLRERRFWNYKELHRLAELLPCDSRRHPEPGALPCLFPYGARAEIARRAKENPRGDPLFDGGDDLDAVIHYSRALELVRVIEDAPARLVARLERHGLSRRASACRFALAVYLRHGQRVLEEQPRLTVGTVHGVKGGEADHVIAWPAFSPAGLASPMTERLCVAYVAMTRARQQLTLFSAPPAGWRPW